MISMAIVGLMMGGILTGVVGIARSNLTVSNHALLNARERNAIEQLAQDVRQLKALSAFTGTGFSGTLPGESDAVAGDDELTYVFSGGALTRSLLLADGTSSTHTSLPGISSLAFSYWTGEGLAAVPGDTSADSIKVIQLEAITRLAAGSQSNTDTVISARFTIRGAGGL